METKPLMSVPDLAEYLQVPVSRVYYLLFRRQLPCLKIGRSVRFRRAEIETWLAETEVKPLETVLN